MTNRQYLVWLSTLLGLFLMRVLGQLAMYLELTQALPPMKAWYSGLIPYGALLCLQVLILILGACTLLLVRNASICGAFPRLGRTLQWTAIIYFVLMALRLLVYLGAVMGYLPEAPLRAWLPIPFHWVLAAYLYLFGNYVNEKA